MKHGRIVIVGAGQGGFQAAASLRQEGFEGDITLIGNEPGLPYQRPPLSKAYLKTGNADQLALRPASFYDKKDISLRTGLRVDRIDREAHEVVTSDGEHLPYDHLILATGARTRRPPLEGVDHALDLRTLADAERLLGALERPCRVAVIGGGFIGLEFAAVAIGLGHAIEVAESAPRVMARAVSPAMSLLFQEMHADLGAVLHLGRSVRLVEEDRITLDDGTAIPADLVVLAAGVQPNTELAEEAGLACDNGIVVDAQMSTVDPAISALGDCAVFPDPRTGRQVRLESVQAATDQARAIAKRLVHGADDPYAAVPWFWSDQGDWKLQIAGLGGPQDESVRVGENAILRFDGEALSAVETVNNPKLHMKARRLMADRACPTRQELAAEGFDLLAF